RTFVALINRSSSGKTSSLDKFHLSRAQIIWGMYFQKNVDYVELLWEDFTYQIDNKDFKKQEKMYYPRFTKLYGVVLPECLTSPEMKESKAYKTYLGYATDEEPVQKGKRVKRSAKKSTTTPATSMVIRETPIKTKSIGKEKVDVSRGNGIDLLSEVALAEKAQLKEVRKKSLRDFHKTHPSGSWVPDVAEDDSTKSDSESWGNDEDDSNDEQESKDESSVQENESEEQESDDSEQEDESDDDDQEEEEFVHTPSPTDDKDDENLESESDEVIKSDEENENG
ncbi:hypothetical protein Tco_0028361, partial [Tanacetum coccineum]